MNFVWPTSGSPPFQILSWATLQKSLNEVTPNPGSDTMPHARKTRTIQGADAFATLTTESYPLAAT
ncbi:MAG: hypothetical protein M1608_03120 [Candidatus Omnitrophica bacterium]|nr:hypothetical protein [Candidatus Omnitrophota bacterium]